MSSPVWITKETVAKLSHELTALYHQKRELAEEIMASLQESAETNHDNFPWEDATRRRHRLEGRIIETKAILSNHRLIDDLEADTTSVGIGTIVGVQIGDDAYSLTILGSYESEPENDVISHLAPLAQMLEGRKVGDVVQAEEVSTVNKDGSESIRIISISSWKASKR